MSTVTVQEFADELKRPVTELLSQLKEAGVSAEGAKSALTAQDKMALLGYLRSKARTPLGTVSSSA
ncbi:MAG TPA: translation initiation factor IF-2 N-terminal domain-containing protein, partial [Nevskiaceae bacterium]|nr:translation initiation factor IF-2 N-terminal domain-containing protein [Nevskiaceae bacterium]